MLTREQILAANDMEYGEVDVPEWGGKVRIRTISSKARQDFQKMVGKDGKVAPDFMENLVVAAVCNEEGKPIFTPADVKALSEKSSIVIDRIFTEVCRLNGLSQEGRDEIKGE